MNFFDNNSIGSGPSSKHCDNGSRENNDGAWSSSNSRGTHSGPDSSHRRELGGELDHQSQLGNHSQSEEPSQVQSGGCSSWCNGFCGSVCGAIRSCLCCLVCVSEDANQGGQGEGENVGGQASANQGFEHGEEGERVDDVHHYPTRLGEHVGEEISYC